MDQTHRKRRLAGLGAIALLVPGGAALTSCGSSSPSSSAPAASTTPKTVHYYSASTSMNMYSANGSPSNSNGPPAPGDYIDGTGTDYSGNHSSHSSTVAGSDHLACTFTTVTASGATAICQGQIALGNSMLLAQHVTVNFGGTSNTVTVPLTGGTGQYQGIHGTVAGTQVGDSNNTDFTITFSK